MPCASAFVSVGGRAVAVVVVDLDGFVVVHTVCHVKTLIVIERT